MKAYIVCEDKYDVFLLKYLLPEELIRDVEFVSAGGLSAIKSLARSLIVRRQAPVAIVVDADTTLSEQVDQKLQDIQEIVENIAANTPVKVILAVPEIEVVFFQDANLLLNLLGYSPSQDILNLATHQPRKALDQLLGQSEVTQDRYQLVNRLTREDIKILRGNVVIQEVIQFLESVREAVSIS